MAAVHGTPPPTAQRCVVSQPRSRLPSTQDNSLRRICVRRTCKAQEALRLLHTPTINGNAQVLLRRAREENGRGRAGNVTWHHRAAVVTGAALATFGCVHCPTLDQRHLQRHTRRLRDAERRGRRECDQQNRQHDADKFAHGAQNRNLVSGYQRNCLHRCAIGGPTRDIGICIRRPPACCVASGTSAIPGKRSDLEDAMGSR